MVKTWDALDADAFFEPVGKPLSSVVTRVRAWAAGEAAAVATLAAAARAAAAERDTEEIGRVVDA